MASGVSYWITISPWLDKVVPQSDEKSKPQYWETPAGIREAIALAEQQKKAEAQKRAECERYFGHLKQPLESPEEIVDLISKGYDEKGFNEKVDWYIHRGNSRVINAVIADLPKRSQVKFPERGGKKTLCVEVVHKREAIGMLEDCYGANKEVGPVLHGALWTYASEKIRPDLIYLLLLRLADLSCEEYYTDESVKKDIFSYLHIYLDYKDYPVIRVQVESLISRYGAGRWHWNGAMQKVYELANKEGLDVAFNYYLTVFKSRNPNQPMGVR
jgi:hypothetical protein